jgi:hypothetical protein
MVQMFDKTRDQMNNWRWDNPCGLEDQVDRLNPHTTSLGKVQPTSEHFSWYGTDDLRVMIEAPSRRQYKPGDFSAVRRLNCDEIIDEDEVDDNGVDARGPSGGRSHPCDANDNHDSESEEDMQGGQKGIGKL